MGLGTNLLIGFVGIIIAGIIIFIVIDFINRMIARRLKKKYDRDDDKGRPSTTNTFGGPEGGDGEVVQPKPIPHPPIEFTGQHLLASSIVSSA